MLQNNPQVGAMRRAVTGRVISEFESLAEKDAEAYGKLWDAFGRVLKEGLYEDFERREALLKLARFDTTAGAKRSLAQYVADFKPSQTEIYYLVGDTLERLKANPKLEAARARGVEVLLLTDPVDAFWAASRLDFGGKPLKSLSQGEVDFGLIPLLEPEKKDDTAQESDAKPAADAAVIAGVKAALGERVSDVRVSTRLTDSAACLVAGDGPDRELERLLARHDRGSGAKPVLELNMRHPIIRALARAGEGGRTAELEDLSLLLFDQAQILDGEMPSDPAAFARRLNDFVVRAVS
jgi:molecular chaperone HtpG